MDDLFSDRASPDPIVRGQKLTRSDAALLCAASPRHLVDCDLEEADLAQLDLSHWTFESCIVRRTDFGGAKLEGTVWQSCRGPFANFTGSDLTDARFVASDFNNSSFRRAALSCATVERCKLTGSDLTDAKALDLSIAETLLINAKLPGFSFHRQTLRRIDFSQADLRKCDFRFAIFEDCSLREAAMTGSRFDNADLRGADLGGLKLIDAGLFRGATISRQQAAQLLAELGLKVP